MIETICPSCGYNDNDIFHEQNRVPAHSVLNIPTREAAIEYKRGDLRLAYCSACDFIWNAAFDQGLMEYSSECEESQGCSPTFSAFAKELADDLVARHHLKGKTILEIGCGKGEFLAMLCERGGNRGIGFDPAYVERNETQAAQESITFVRDYYSEKYKDYQADLICCRMTLEHIPHTGRLVRSVRASMDGDPETVVFFQVPDVTRILKDCAFEDIYYEHCSYFSPGSLAALFENNDFAVTELKTVYDGQYILLEARPKASWQSPRPIDDRNEINALVDSFGKRFKDKVGYWRGRIESAAENGSRVVLWGGGSKAVAFLTTLGTDREIEYVVDINPHRQGFFMPGTGHEIVSPSFLKTYRPDLVIIMNPVYRDEIQAELVGLGLTPEITTL